MNETEQFLQDTERDESVDILNQPITPEEPQAQPEEKPKDQPTETPEDEGEEQLEGEEAEEGNNQPKPKTRRERRLVRKLEAERESSRQMAEKLQAVTESAKDLDDADYLKGIERIYGTDSPEAQMATDLLRNALVGIRKDAEESAYNRIRSEREAETQAEQQRQAELESFLDTVEDTYRVTLTESQEKSYLTLLEKMSPKDAKGKVIAYADPLTVYEVFKDRSTHNKPKTPPRAKEVSSRSLSQGTSPDDSKIQEDSNVRFLKENGII